MLRRVGVDALRLLAEAGADLEFGVPATSHLSAIKLSMLTTVQPSAMQANSSCRAGHPG